MKVPFVLLAILCAVCTTACNDAGAPTPPKPASLVLICDKTFAVPAEEILSRWQKKAEQLIISSTMNNDDRITIGLVTANTENNLPFDTAFRLADCTILTDYTEIQQCEKVNRKAKSGILKAVSAKFNAILHAQPNATTSRQSEFWGSVALAAQRFKGREGQKCLAFFSDMKQHGPLRKFALASGLPKDATQARTWGEQDAKNRMKEFGLDKAAFKGASVLLQFPTSANEAESGRRLMVEYWRAAFGQLGLAPDSLLDY